MKIILAAARKRARHHYGKARAGAMRHKKMAGDFLSEYRTHKASGDRAKARHALLNYHSAQAAYHSSWEHPNATRAKRHLEAAQRLRARMKKIR